MFMDASVPHASQDKARMLSKPYSPTSGSCLSFWYYIYGENLMVGTISVMVTTVGQQASLPPLISIGGSQGLQWHLASVNIHSIEKFQVSSSA